MVVWQMGFDTNTYQSIDLSSKTAGWLSDCWVNGFKGESMIDNWQVVGVSFIQGDARIAGDFPSLPGFTPPVFTVRALNVLMPLIHADIEILPLDCNSEQLYAINILSILDCLDKDRSRLIYFSDGKRVMRIEKHVFLNDCLGAVHIFKLPEQIKNKHYVSDHFKATVEHHGLRGMTFTNIWAG